MPMPRFNICNKCNSKSYCANAENGMLACENFNKFPRENKDEKSARTSKQ